MASHMATSERYELQEEIARGGQGIVFTARDHILHRDVAIKTLREGHSPQSAASKRFLDEARITGQLQHPGIPPIHDLGALPDGRPFLAMKLIRGRTLAEALSTTGESLTPTQAIPIFEQVCHAVAYAHARGVIHRDLKPANVMVGAFGEVHVMDWGLAKVLALRTSTLSTSNDSETTAAATEIHSDREDSSETRAGSILGTPAYMPPEQAIGAIDQLDTRCDVFGLGAILCVILTGKPPYVGADSESTRQLAARAKLDDAFARLDSCGAEAEWLALCKYCLAAEKTDRPADADVVARTVASLRTAASERARLAEIERVRTEGELREAQTKASEAKKRRRTQLAFISCLAFLLASGAAFAWRLDRQANQRRTVELQRQFEDEQRLHAEGSRNLRNAEAVQVLLQQCEAALTEENSDKAILALDAAEKRTAEGGADKFGERLKRLRRDIALMNELDRIDLLRYVIIDEKLPSQERIAIEWEKAFTSWGLVLGTTSPEEAERLINLSPTRERILTILDEWLFITGGNRLLQILVKADPDEFRKAVRTSTSKRDWMGVIKLADQPEALDQPPRYAAVLGKVLLLPGERRNQILTIGIQRRPSDFGMLMTRASSGPQDGKNRFGDPEIWLRASIAARPFSPLAHYNLATVLHAKGDLEGALHEFREAIRLDPNNNVYFRHNFVTLLQQIGDYDSAEEELRDCIRLEPSNVRNYIALGWVLNAKKDTAGALAAFQEVIRLDPSNAYAYDFMAYLHLQAGHPEAAIPFAEKSVELEPKVAQAHFNLGCARLGIGTDPSSAVTALRTAVKLDSEHTAAKQYLQLALQAEKQAKIAPPPREVPKP